MLMQARVQHQAEQGQCQDVVLVAKPKMAGLLDLDIGLCRRLRRECSRAVPAGGGIR
ncbi:hypothetical protein D3C71_1765510 [compost metagenome]